MRRGVKWGMRWMSVSVFCQGTANINKTVHTVTASDPDDGPGGSVVFSMAVG